ncbi:9166_t:CDS:2, partial [Ambispora leptoticha]
MAQYVRETTTTTTEYNKNNVNNSNAYYAEQQQDAINVLNGTTTANNTTATLPTVTKDQIYDNSAVGYSYDASYYNGQDYSQYYDYSQQQQYYDTNQQQYDPNQHQYGQATYDSSYGYYYGQTYDPSQPYNSSLYSNDPTHDSTLYQHDTSAYYNYLPESSDQIYQDPQYYQKVPAEYPTVAAEEQQQQQQQSIITNDENLNKTANHEADPESIFDALGNESLDKSVNHEADLESVFDALGDKTETIQKKLSTEDLQLKNSANEKSAEDDKNANVNCKSLEFNLTKSEESVGTITDINVNPNLQILNSDDIIEQHKSEDVNQNSDLTQSTNDPSYQEQASGMTEAASSLTTTQVKEAVNAKNDEVSQSIENISTQKEETSLENLVDGDLATTISQENSSEITSIIKEEEVVSNDSRKEEHEDVSNLSHGDNSNDTVTATSNVSLTETTEKTDDNSLIAVDKNTLDDNVNNALGVNINNKNNDPINKVDADSQEKDELYFGETNKGVGLDGDDQDLFQNTPVTNNPYYSDYSYYDGQNWEQVYGGEYLNYDAYGTQYQQQQENTNGHDGQISNYSWVNNQSVSPKQIQETTSHLSELSLETQTLPTLYQVSNSPAIANNVSICPDPNCHGENKPTAKFCCECGRSMENNFSEIPFSQEKLHDYYTNTQNATTSPNPYTQPHVGYSAEINQRNNINGGYDSQHNYYEYNQSYSYDTSDPLQRSRGCPVIAFGFGGHIFTMFPRTVQRFTSTDQSIPITKSAPGAFIMRTLKDIIPMSKVENFPGPLLMDNNKGGVKSKRKEILKYIDLRLNEVKDQPLSHEVSDIEKVTAEDSATIWKLLKIMIENDGHIIGNTKVEEAVRNVLIPSFSSSNNTDESTAEFTIPADSGYNSREMAEPTRSLSTSSTTYSVNPSTIDKLQEILLKGDRVSAVRLAMRNNLWSHALIIASCVNKDLWKEVVNEFVRQELSVEACEPAQSNGRESLRVLYALLSGQGQNA